MSGSHNTHFLSGDRWFPILSLFSWNAHLTHSYRVQPLLQQFLLILEMWVLAQYFVSTRFQWRQLDLNQSLSRLWSNPGRIYSQQESLESLLWNLLLRQAFCDSLRGLPDGLFGDRNIFRREDCILDYIWYSHARMLQQPLISTLLRQSTIFSVLLQSSTHFSIKIRHNNFVCGISKIRKAF